MPVPTRTYTIVCKHTTTYIQTAYQPQQLTCVCCGRPPKQVRPLSELDLFTTQYNISPLLANVLSAQCNLHNIRDRGPQSKRYLSLEQYAELINMHKNPITPLNVHCTNCGSTFTLLRTVPTTSKTPPIHCVYCAQTNITINQASTEETAFISLAEHYNLPLSTLQYLYNFWTGRPNYPTFNEFMNSNTVTQLKQILLAGVPA